MRKNTPQNLKAIWFLVAVFMFLLPVKATENNKSNTDKDPLDLTSVFYAPPVIDLNGITTGVNHEVNYQATPSTVAFIASSPTLTSDTGTILSATIDVANNTDATEIMYHFSDGFIYNLGATNAPRDYTYAGSTIRVSHNLTSFTITEAFGNPIPNADFLSFLGDFAYGNLTNTPTVAPRTITVNVTDVSLNTSSAVTTMRVYSELPSATDDTNSTLANNPGTVSGNVLTDGADTGTGIFVSEVDVYPAQVGNAYQTLYGTFVINANGTYTYDVDNANPAVTGLKNGESIQDIVSYTIEDAAGIIDYGILTITINGVDDAPVALDNTNQIDVVTEANVSGNIITDIGVDGADFVDRGLSQLIWENEFSAPGGVFGGLSAPVNGQTRTISGVNLNFTSTDISNIGVPDQNQTVVQTGTNGGHTGYLLFAIDAATNPSNDTQLIIDFSEPVFNLGFLVTDIDFSQGTSWQDQMQINGSLGGNPSNYTFTTTAGVVVAGNDTYYGTGNAIASDATGNINVFFEEPIDQLVLSYNYGPDATDADQGGQIAGISDIYWQGDNPNIVISEIDASAANVNTTYTGTYGTIIVNSDGSYTYTPDTTNPAVAGLLVGDTLTETFLYRLSDGSNSDTANLIITLNGTKNPPTISITTPIEGDDVVNASEDGDVTISGTTEYVEDGQVVTVTFSDGTNTVTTTATVSGNTWTATDADISGLDNGTVTVTADVTDVAGNPATDNDPVTLDNNTPEVDSFSTIDITPILTGLGDANEQLTIELDTDGDGTIDVTYIVTTNSSGNWSIDTGNATPVSGTFPTLGDEDIIDITATDNAGNSNTGIVTISVDTDGDGLNNNEEITLGTDPNNPDSDGDGINDGQEVLDGTNPLDDCDSVSGTPLESSDCDADGLTNAEEANLGTDPSNADTDNDGLLDSEEVGLDTDPLNPDTDGDGINDGQEVLDNTNPLEDCDSVDGTPLGASDCDADGLTNAEEANLGTNPENPDTDGDGINDGQEVIDETDPLDGCNSSGGTPPAGSACDIEIESDLMNPTLGQNTFRIINIEQFPNNTVEIFNRWGVKVFSAKGYDNDSNSFQGISNGRVTIQANEELPAGVYYYIINYENDGSARSRTGYLYLNR